MATSKMKEVSLLAIMCHVLYESDTVGVEQKPERQPLKETDDEKTPLRV